MSAMSFAKTIIKNLFGQRVTEEYPVKERQVYDVTRGHIEIEIDKCLFCGLCSRKCPSQAITVNRNDKVWEINRLRCIQCGYCAESCPKKCLSIENDYSKPEVETKTQKYNIKQ